MESDATSTQSIDDKEECESDGQCGEGESCVACSCTDCTAVKKEMQDLQQTRYALYKQSGKTEMEWLYEKVGGKDGKERYKIYLDECKLKIPDWLKRCPGVTAARGSFQCAGLKMRSDVDAI